MCRKKKKKFHHTCLFTGCHEKIKITHKHPADKKEVSFTGKRNRKLRLNSQELCLTEHSRSSAATPHFLAEHSFEAQQHLSFLKVVIYFF